MKQQKKSKLTRMALALALALGGLAAGQVALAAGGLATSRAAQAKERLAVDDERKYDAGLFGRKVDDTYALTGKRITREVFTCEVKERLAVDVERKYDAGLFGRKEDDTYALTGKRITRYEFTPEVTAGLVGGGNASVIDADITKGVKVHWWIDATCRLRYRLKVWVQD